MSYRNYGYDEDELSGAFSSLSVKKGRGSTVGKSSGAKFPEYEEELQKRPLSSARRTGPPPCGPCAVVSNQAVRRRLGVEGDPSVDIDHIYEKHRAEVRGQNADIEVSIAPGCAGSLRTIIQHVQQHGVVPCLRLSAPKTAIQLGNQPYVCSGESCTTQQQYACRLCHH